MYIEVKEAIQNNCHKPLGRGVDLCMFIDSDHATYETTRRSRTGYFIYMNSVLVNWLSTKQTTIETSVFGAEFVAMNKGMEALHGLHYKFRMRGMRISGLTFVYGDNMSVIHNIQRPESNLGKKSNSICYHPMRELVSMGESLTRHIPTAENFADLAIKIIPGKQMRDHLMGKLLLDILY